MNENLEGEVADSSGNYQTNKALSVHSPNTNEKEVTQQLLQNLQFLPDDWAFVPVGDNKAPIGKDWQSTPLTKKCFETAVKVGYFQELKVNTKNGEAIHPPTSWLYAIGVLCGTPSGGLLFVDHDGASCDELIKELSGQPIMEVLPKTPTLTSGRQGRYQAIYRVPERYWGAITTKRVNTGVTDDDNKPEQLEFRWNGCQSVVTGHHPITKGYFWLPERSPTDCEVLDAPAWMIEQMLKVPSPHQSTSTKLEPQTIVQAWTEKDWVLSYLAAIPSSEEYDIWIKVGMALHSANNDLLDAWDNWSRGAINYEEGACEKHWKSFKSVGGISIGTLGLLAKQNGWRVPLSGGERSSYFQPLIHETTEHRPPRPSAESSDENFEELAQEVQSLVDLTEETAPFRLLLSSRLTLPLTNLATRLNVPPETFIGVMLPITASLLKVGTRIEIDATTNFRPPPIFWTGLVGESGATKSPIFDSLLSPLAEMQSEADDLYQLEFVNYKDELEDWQALSKEERGDKPVAPIQREYVFQDATLEAVFDCLSRQPNRGVIIANDELASLFNGFNQYRSHGRGNDLQRWLSLYDGRSIKVNRKTGNRISLSQTQVSLTGTIQPCVLQKHMENVNEVDGFWPRYFWIRLPLTKMPPPGEGNNYNLSGLLRGLYQGLEILNSNVYQLDKDGREVWRHWHCWCEEKKVNEFYPALRSLYPKSKERAARIALIAHCINAVIEGSIPEKIIASKQLEAAIEFTKWSIGQTRLIYADAGITTWQESPKIARFVERFKRVGWIKTRQVIHWHSSREKPNAETARAFMKQIVALGYAISNGKNGKEFQIRIKDDYENNGNNQSVVPHLEDTSLGNICSNNLVTNNGLISESITDEAFESGNNLVGQHSNRNGSVTIDAHSLEMVSGGESSTKHKDLLSEVTECVIKPKALTGNGSETICYQVTDFKHQSEEHTVFVGNKSEHPSKELQLPKVKTHNCTIMHSSESNEWYTLQKWTDKARKLMGEITLDPASNVEAQSWINATQYYTQKQDGMNLSWFGCVWLNPPYGKRSLKDGVYGSTAWILKAIAEFKAGNVTQAVLWLRAGGNKGIQALEDKGFPRVVLGRENHAPPGAGGNPQKGAGHDTVVYYLGAHVERFKVLFGREP